MHVYIFIYISLLANKRLATLLLDRWAGIRCTLLNSFFFFLNSSGEAEAFGMKNNQRTRKKKGPVQRITAWKTGVPDTQEGQQKIVNNKALPYIYGSQQRSIFFSSDENGEYSSSGGVGKLTIQGCDYLQNSVKTVQKKKGVIKEQLWSKPRLSFYEKLPMPSHEQSRSSSNRQAQWSLLATVCKALLTLRPSCNLVA